MLKEIHFSAQALDNTSDDHYASTTLATSVTAPDERQYIISLTGDVALSGKKMVTIDGGYEFILIRNWFKPNQFLFRMPANEKDCVGRIAPMLCVGTYTGNLDVKEVFQHFKQFATNIGRTVNY